MSTCVMPTDQLGKTSGVIVWKGRLYPRTMDFPSLVFDLDAWVRTRCASLLAEADSAFNDNDCESAKEFEDMAVELSAWLQTHEGVITTDFALQARSKIQPFIVDSTNFEKWMNKLVALGHELETPVFDFLLLADEPTPILFSVSTVAAVKHTGKFVKGELISQNELDDKIGAIMLKQAKKSNAKQPHLHMPITNRWLSLWDSVRHKETKQLDHNHDDEKVGV